MANKFQIKRTSTSGVTPNTTNSSNTAYIAPGELAINMADRKLFSANTSSGLIELGSNLTNLSVTSSATLNNNINLNFKDLSGNTAFFKLQDDNNFVFYNTNTSGGARAIWASFANSTTSTFQTVVALEPQGGIYANGTLGTAGQVLTSSGTGTYWSAAGSGSGLSAGNGLGSNSTHYFVNTAYSFTWSNTHTFSANVSFGNSISITSGNSSASGGMLFFNTLGDTNWKMGRNTNGTTKWYYTNNTIDIISAASNLEGVVIGQISGNSFFETGYAGTFIRSNVTIGNGSANSTINATSFSGTANNATYAYGKTEINLNVNSAGTATISNNASYLGGTAAASYQLNSTLSANVATMTANNATYAFGKSEGGLNVNNATTATTANNSTYAFGKSEINLNVNNATTATTANNSTYAFGKTEGAINANSALTANNTTYVNGKTEGNLNVNNAVTANNSTYLNGQAASYYTNATNITAGTLPYAQIPANVVNTTANFTIGGNTTFSGILTATGGSKISVQEGVDGTSTRGIFLWNDTDSNWGIYMAQAGVGKSLANATSSSGLNGSSTWAVRFRAANGAPTDNAGFIWENNFETVLMQLEPTNGNLFVKNSINAASYNVGSSFIANSTGITGTLLTTSQPNITANNTTYFGGYTWAAPGALGTTTANSGTFTTVNASASVNSAVLAVGTSYVANSTQLTLASTYKISANGSTGTAGQVLTSNATAVYWSTPTTGTVTSVASGNGLTGGPITSTGTLSVVANSGLVSNATGVFVIANSGLISNSTGVFVNANTELSANSTGVFHIDIARSNNTSTASPASGGTFTAIDSITTNARGHVTAINTKTVTLPVDPDTNTTYDLLPIANTSQGILRLTASTLANDDVTFLGSGTTTVSSNATHIVVNSADQYVGTVTSVTGGSGLTGSVTTSGSLEVGAGVGITVNADDVAINANTGIIANSTGVFVNSSYIATISANNADYLDGQHGSYYTNATNITTGTLPEAQLPYRMDQNVRTTDTVTFGNITVSGNLTVSGTTTTINANNLNIEDNMIYLNAGGANANPDLGWAGNYNDGTYRHAGMFRDASDGGKFKVFDSYTPEPDASPWIDTANNTFRIADFQANVATFASANVSSTITAGSDIYTKGKVGYANSTGSSVAYTYYNSSTNSLDTVFG